MANTFVGNRGDTFSASNGLTSVLLARIAVAAAREATLAWEHQFARWIATRDQTWFGPGIVQFDLREIPWGATSAEWDPRQTFVVRVIRAAALPELDAQLPWRPAPDQLEYQRGQRRELAELVERFDPARCEPPCATGWDWSLAPTDVLCRPHGVYEHAQGRMICRDGWA